MVTMLRALSGQVAGADQGRRMAPVGRATGATRQQESDRVAQVAPQPGHTGGIGVTTVSSKGS
jgi:hypothetical protein